MKAMARLLLLFATATTAMAGITKKPSSLSGTSLHTNIHLLRGRKLGPNAKGRGSDKKDKKQKEKLSKDGADLVEEARDGGKPNIEGNRNEPIDDGDTNYAAAATENAELIEEGTRGESNIEINLIDMYNAAPAGAELIDEDTTEGEYSDVEPNTNAKSNKPTEETDMWPHAVPVTTSAAFVEDIDENYAANKEDSDHLIPELVEDTMSNYLVPDCGKNLPPWKGDTYPTENQCHGSCECDTGCCAPYHYHICVHPTSGAGVWADRCVDAVRIDP